MAHFHYCEQCGDEYTCTAPFEERRNDSLWLRCVTRTEADRRYRLCVSCAEVEPSSYEADRHDALRAADEQLPHVAANSDLGRDIAKRVRTERKRG